MSWIAWISRWDNIKDWPNKNNTIQAIRPEQYNQSDAINNTVKAIKAIQPMTKSVQTQEW